MKRLPAVHPIPAAQQRVIDLLKQAGIEPNQVPRTDGIFLEGYRTVNRPLVVVDGTYLATTWHYWECSPELARAIWDAYVDLEFTSIADHTENA